MCAYERGPVAKTVYSDNQNNVDALAERLSGQTSLSAERAKLVAYDLLCRKALKIKSSALAQIFRSVDKECDTKAMRDELIAAKIVTKIEGSGINGRPAFYTINAEICDVQEQPVEVAEEASVDDSVEMPAVEEVAPREHVDTDELLDEHVVRAFTAKAGRGGFGGGSKRDAQRRAQQDKDGDGAAGQQLFLFFGECAVLLHGTNASFFRMWYHPTTKCAEIFEQEMKICLKARREPLFRLSACFIGYRR